MFKDDKLIGVLTAIVLMVAIGTVVQRSDGIAEYFGEEKAAPEIVRTQLVADQVKVPVNTLIRIDVFRNDIAVSDGQRAGLKVTEAPVCGRLFIQGGALQYLPESGCEGERLISYTVPGLGEAVGKVTVIVEGDGTQRPTAPTAEPSAPVLAEAETQPTTGRVIPKERPQPRVVYSPGHQPQQSEQQPEQQRAQPTEAEVAANEVIETLTQGTAETAQAETPEIAELQRSEPENPEPLTAFKEAPQPDLPDPEETLAVLDEVKAPTQPAPRAAPASLSGEGTDAQAPTLPEADPVLARGLRGFEPSQPKGLRETPDTSVFEVDVARGPDLNRQTEPGAGIQDPTDGGGLMVAVIELREPTTVPPGAPEPRENSDETTSMAVQAAIGSAVRIAALSPTLGPATDGGPGEPLTDAPIDPTAVAPPKPQPQPTPAATPAPEPAATPEPTVTASLDPEAGASDAPSFAPIPTARRPVPSAESQQACEIPPAMTIDVRRAAETVVSVLADCQAGTVAELTYSGLRFAVPLDADGRGSISVLGFESNAPALLSFRNGETIDFDLPFKGVNRVSRIALVWDLPITLELNALEFGATPDSTGHVRPANPRSFNAIRREGGGFLNSYRSAYGVGQNVEIYSHWARRGGETGIVRMMIDFASRSRDRLEETCGTGTYAAPQFLIMRSVRGRLERPIIRKLAALDCSRITEETGDKRLISGAVDDLVITQR